MSEFGYVLGDGGFEFWQWIIPSQEILDFDLRLRLEPDDAIRYLFNRYANDLMPLESYVGPSVDQSHWYSHGKSEDQYMGKKERDESGQEHDERVQLLIDAEGEQVDDQG